MCYHDSKRTTSLSGIATVAFYSYGIGILDVLHKKDWNRNSHGTFSNLNGTRRIEYDAYFTTDIPLGDEF
jgi:hypothetical protein